MIEVFKTNVGESAQAERITELLREQFPGNRINFDLYDCDKILRVEGRDFIPEKIMTLVTAHGFSCRPLE